MVQVAAVGIRAVVNDLENVKNAAQTLQSLKSPLELLDQALASLKTITDDQWRSLGESVLTQSRTTIKSCKKTCDNLRAALDRWT